MRINKNFRVKGQHITCTDDTRIIKGNKNLYYAVFHVDELWDGIELKACFTVDEEPYIMPLERIGKTLECEIPYPANSGIVFGVGIFGGDLISTDIVYTSTTPGIPIDGANPPEPIPDWFNKMEDIARQAMETANSVKEQADSGAFKGDPFTYDDFTHEQLAELKGEPGYTPQKGIDYFTESEVAEIVNKAAEAAGRTEETDPTVPAWAKAANKPTYTASEVGARPDTWTPSASEVGADPTGTAAGTVSSHNTAEDAHSDIRLLIAGLTTRLNALADSDDETLDQVSELVAYIKANRSLIEQVTTGKVSVSDIVDNLTTNASNKPLSAAQGVKLKALIDAITVPTKVSELQNDAGYLTQHQDLTPYAKTADLTSHTGNTTVHITAAERTEWNQAVTDVGTLSEEIVNYLPKNQGSSNVGKILVVGTDGNLTLTEMPEGGASGDVIGTLDEANNILLSGNLADGTYTLKYLNEDGTYTEIGTLEVGAIPEPEPTKTNFFVVGGDGYLNPGRAGSNGADRTDITTCLLSNYIEVQNGDEIYAYRACSSNADVALMALYKADKTGVGFYVRSNPSQLTNISMSDEVDIFTINYEGAAYMRVCCLIPSDLNTLVVNIKRNGEWL